MKDLGVITNNTLLKYMCSVYNIFTSLF